MEEKLKELQAAALAEIAGAKSTEELEAFAVRVLGKKGELTALLRGMGSLPPEQRPIMGQMVNGARQAIEGAMEERRAQLGAADTTGPVCSGGVGRDAARPRARPGLAASAVHRAAGPDRRICGYGLLDRRGF